MAEIDSLDIKISSDAKVANNAINSIIRSLDNLAEKLKIDTSGLGKIGKNLDFSKITDGAKTMSETVGKAGATMAQSMKPVQEQTKKVEESIIKTSEEISKNLSKDISFDMDFSKFDSVKEDAENIGKSIQSVISSISNLDEANRISAQKLVNSFSRQYLSYEKQEKKVVSLREKIEKLSGQKIKTDEFSEIEKQLDRTRSRLNGLLEAQKRFVEYGGKTTSSTYKKRADEIEELRKNTKELEKEIGQVKESGKAYKIPNLSSEYEKLISEEKKLELENARLSTSFEDLMLKLNKFYNVSLRKEKVEIQVPEAPKYDLEYLQHLQDVGATKLLEDYLKDIENSTKEATESAKEFIGTWEKAKFPDIKSEKFEISAFEEKIRSVIDETNKIRESGQVVGVFQSLKNVFSQMSIPLVELDGKIRNFKDSLAQMREQGQTIGIGSSLIDAVTPINSIDRIMGKLNEFKESASETGNRIRESLQNNNFSRIGDGAEISNGKIVDLNARLQELQNHLKKLKAEGIGLGFTDYEETVSEIARINEQLKKYENNLINSKNAISAMSNAGKRLSGALNGIYAPLKRLNSGINKALSGIGRLAKSMLLLGKSAKTSSKGFDLNLKTILKYGFGIRSVYMLVNKLRNAIKEGMKNLVQYSAETNASVSMLVSSLATLKNASAAAASPLLNAIAPALNQLIQLFIRATNAVNQFLSALFGRSTWIKAKDQVIDYADSISDASKAAKGALQPFDKLNNLTSQQAAGGGIDPGDMFETLPIESKFKDLADKVKDILRKLFAPLKEAWNRQGKFVMKAWKYALDEVWKLIKDIGRDFLKVWQQEKTIKIFEDILRIIGDIGLVIGNLARNFRDAWNENETGLHILENIRDIIGVIISNIREAADKTVEWADKLNFSPLLEAFERFTESLIPVADALSGVLSDFYTEVLLPLGKWTIEKGLPELLDVFTAFNEKVDWQALRDNLAEFWRHLEPFAETVGEGLIIFIQRVSDALADFLNSQEFKDFLVMIEDWMDSVTPEDVADALEKIAKALIVLKLAVLGFGAISVVSGVFTTLITFFSSIGKIGGLVISGAKLIVGGIGSILSAIGSIPAVLAMVAAAVAGWKIGEWINEKLFGIDTPSFFEMMEGIKSSFRDGSWKEALRLWGEDIKADWSEIWGYVKEDFNNSIIGSVLGSFKDGSWKEALRIWGADIKSAWSEIWEYVKEKAHEAIEKVKGFLKFEWSLPKIKLPHFKISGKFSLTPPSVPSIGVDWYAKGGIFDQAQVIGVGEAGREAVLPLTDSKAMKMIADGIMNQYQGAGTYGTEGYQVNGQSESLLRTLIQKNEEQNQLLRAILDKEFGITKDQVGKAAQEYSQEYYKRNGRYAYS